MKAINKKSDNEIIDKKSDNEIIGTKIVDKDKKEKNEEKQ